MHLTDGGLETTLVFQDGLELPDFASFPLLDDETGTALVDRYFLPYLDLAEQQGCPVRAGHRDLAGQR